MRSKYVQFSAAFLAGMVALGFSQTAWATELLRGARVAAEWAIETGNPNALATSLGIILDEGGTLEPDDPFSALDLAEELRKFPNGEALLKQILETQSRGQLGGAPRVDVVLGPGEVHITRVKLVASELSWIEARLWRGAGQADIDLNLLDPLGDVIASDQGSETGVEGVAALLDVWVETCTDATLQITNTGMSEGRVAIFIPQSMRQDCEAPE